MKWTQPAEKALVSTTAALMARDGSNALEHLRQARTQLNEAIDQLEVFQELDELDLKEPHP